jgi:hypothetical protein
MRIAAALLIALSVVQDDPRVRQLIQQLEDDSFEVREQAERALVALGEPAVGPLKKAVADAQARKDGSELALRASSALRQIDLASKARKVYTEPRTVTLSVRDEELGKVLEEVGRQAGVRIDASAVDLREKVTLDAAKAPLLRVLDDLCRGQAERTFELRDDGTVKLARERHVSFPACYEGPFRVRVLKMRLERSTDFKDRKATLHLTLGADYERYLKPSKKIDLEIARATDDKGTALEARAGTGAEEDDFIGLRRVIRVMPGMPTAPEAGQPFFLKGLAPGATRVTLSGTARFSFPLDLREVVFDKVEAGEAREAGDYTVKIERLVARRFWTVSIRKTRGKGDGAGAQDLDARLDKDSGVAVDEDGTEHKGVFTPSLDREMQIVVGPGGVVQESGGGGTYQLSFPSLGAKKARQLKFRFVDSTFVKPVPLKFEGLELP